eukprot:5293688-Pyramimonas_sp.AAC.1
MLAASVDPWAGGPPKPAKSPPPAKPDPRAGRMPGEHPPLPRGPPSDVPGVPPVKPPPVVNCQHPVSAMRCYGNQWGRGSKCTA